MASRSISSTPSEGEIVESDTGTSKATTSLPSVNGISVDRHTRTKPVPRSPIKSPRRPRSRSRSPYRESRGEKRRRDDEYLSDGHGRSDPRRFNVRYENRLYDDGHRRQRSYEDLDRGSTGSSHLRYDEDIDGHHSKRPKTRSRSRSPFRHNRKPDPSTLNDRGSRNVSFGLQNGGIHGGNTRPSTEQSVSEMGKLPVIARTSKPETETRGHQVHQDTSQHPSSSAQADTDPTGNGQSDTGSALTTGPVDEATLIEERRKKREAIRAKYKGQATPLLVQALQLGNEAASSTPSADTSCISSRRSESPQASPPQTPKDTSGLQSPTDIVIKDEDLANADTNGEVGAERDEPSAADYDPTMDMEEDRLKHDKRLHGEDVSSAAYDETQPTKQDILVPQDSEQEAPPMKAKDAFDMFAEDDDDDMFAEAPISKPSAPSNAKPSAQQPQLLDTGMLDNWDDPEGYYNIMLGELIDGRYHVQQNLGRGMFSSVVRAMDSRTDSLVALKIIRNNDTMRKAGLKEISILQDLRTADPDDKKHVIRFDRHFEHKGHLAMVFENLSMNLREVLKKFGRDVGINLKAIRAYAQQMFLGLSLLRKCNILHADLKPDNVLVNEGRNVLKICDLGSASPASENEITPYLVSRFYRAPEIILGITYDYAIDVWSVGCTLFELYTGKILFTGRTNNQMLRSIMECRGKFPHKFLRRGTLTHMHFDDLLNFQSLEEDRVSGRAVTRVLDFKKPTRDLKQRLTGKGTKGMSGGETEQKEVNLFMDLLDKCLNVNPEKRCTPSDALKHPFILRAKG